MHYKRVATCSTLYDPETGLRYWPIILPRRRRCAKNVDITNKYSVILSNANTISNSYKRASIFSLSVPVMNGLFIVTSGSIRIAFTKVHEDRGQLFYKVSGNYTSECFVYCQKCQVDDLSPLTHYNFTVTACIKEEPTLCGDPSPDLITSTAPKSK